MAAALALGATGHALLGDGPGSATAGHLVAVDWTSPAVPSQELSAADAVWEGRTPWGERPATAAGDGEPEIPPLMLVGVVAESDGSRAVFIVPGQGEVQAKAGDSLPDGGRVTAVTPFLVSWTDGGGTQHEQALLADLRAPLPAAEPTGNPRPPGQARSNAGPPDRPRSTNPPRPPPRTPPPQSPRRP